MIADSSAVIADSLGQTLAIVVSDPNDTQLGALTWPGTAAALPFGGQYSSVDFPLSNCVNSGISRIALLSNRGVDSWLQGVGWRRPAGHEERAARQALRTVDRSRPGGYVGTADGVYRNLHLIESCNPAYVLVHVGSHVARMDYRTLVAAHRARGFGATVGCMEMPAAAARDFGVLGVERNGRVVRFADKPLRPQRLPHDAGLALVSVGVYVFDLPLLIDCLAVDAADPGSTHDLCRDVLPLLIRAGNVAAHVFRDPDLGRRAYWRDLGTLDRYWRANIELLDDQPAIELDDKEWPLWTQAQALAPPRFVAAGVARRALVAVGVTISGRVEGSVLSMDCSVGVGATVIDSVLLPGVDVGRGCSIRKAVVAAGCMVPDGMTIGENPVADAAYFDCSPDGVVLVTAEGLARASSARPRATRPM